MNQPQGTLGWTPLHKAAATDQVEVAQLLLENGAAVNAPDTFGQTPLVVAKDTGASKEMLKLLKDHGADD
jgi:ankyrin repeat protein